MERTWPQLRRIDADHPWVFDVALGIALLIASIAATVDPAPLFRAPDATLYGLLVLGCIPYAWRRRVPLVVLVTASLPVLAIINLGYSSAVIGSGLFLAAYSVSARCSARVTITAAGYVAVVLVAVWTLAPRAMSFGELATNVALFAGAFMLGFAAQTRRQNSALLRERAEMAEQRQAENTHNAVTAERLRLARDLHDIVGHSLAVISVQASVGAHVLDRDPEEARAALQAVSERSRAALSEIRRLLGALRTEADESGAGQRVGADALRALAADFTEAGLPVDLRCSGNDRAIAPMVDRAAYRIVQESLTNTLRHAGSARAEVHVDYLPDAVQLEVLDDGSAEPAGSASPPAGGHGLIGMRERAAALAGTLEYGPRPQGGFRVSARLPNPQQVGA